MLITKLLHPTLPYETEWRQVSLHMRRLTLGVPQNFCFCKSGEQEEKMNPFLAKIPESMTLLLLEVDLSRMDPRHNSQRLGWRLLRRVQSTGQHKLVCSGGLPSDGGLCTYGRRRKVVHKKASLNTLITVCITTQFSFDLTSRTFFLSQFISELGKQRVSSSR